MQIIYSQAQRILVWLGPQANESDKAFELIDVFTCIYDDCRTRCGPELCGPQSLGDYRVFESRETPCCAEPTAGSTARLKIGPSRIPAPPGDPPLGQFGSTIATATPFQHPSPTKAP
ncbi:hypothetical protein N431DRAFT_516387 [Stipitochalara longipes BDJ]|nr:hypothetical protein N431DRAFT_516387 [Stipitochalara longipes BDJ]